MKVVLDVAAGRLSIEGDGPELLQVIEAARSLAPSISQIQIVMSQDPHQQAKNEPSDATNPRPAAPSPRSMTLRQFARSLSLNNAPERVAAIAYYVNKVDGKPSFSPKEMDGWFTMCGFSKPSQMAVALFDTKRKYGYAENFGRGMWRVSNQGENLVVRKIEESQIVLE
jgi:hypothetical protein